jgi:hypothetical protein
VTLWPFSPDRPARTGRSAVARAALLAAAALALTGGCRKPAPLEVISTAFRAGEPIPDIHACRDRSALGASPPIAWSDPPPGTQAIAVVMYDPDARDFVHWVVTNLPPTTRALPPGASPGGALPAGAQEGPNGFDKTGYAGPCPPPGAPHTYVIKVFALPRPVPPPAEHERKFWKRLESQALAVGALTTTHSR